MFPYLNDYLTPPKNYTQSKTSFWTDEHISKKLLALHLDENNDLASRKPEFMEKSVCWIKILLPPAKYTNLLDIGCGPGLYAQRFAKCGYRVTGVDFSRRSIEYAKSHAIAHALPICYLHQNYLNLSLNDSYDSATMIYCDYGALSTQNRKKLMRKIYNALKPGGKFILDVCSVQQYIAFEESQTWEILNEGFWSREKHICINSNRKYEDDTLLNQTVVVTQSSTNSYYIWTHCFGEDNLIDEVTQAGFKPVEFYSDIAGRPFCPDSMTIAVLLEK
jgi:SAM-dependent methyltransferase